MVPNIGDKVTVEFTFEVDSIRRNNHKDGEINIGGWITDENGRVVELISVPVSCIKKE